MSSVLLVALAAVLYLILKRYIEFRQAVATIQDFSGFRTLLSVFGTFNYVLMRVRIPGVTIGAFRSWGTKYEDFRYFDADIISHVSVFPRVWLVSQEITAQRTRYPKPVWQYGILNFFGRNIVTSEADEWKRYRKIAAPAFSEPNNKLVWEEAVRIMSGLFEDVWGAQERIMCDHVVDLTLPIALFVIGAAGFGRRVTWKEDEVVGPGHTMTFKVALRTVSADIVAKLVFPEWFLKYNPIKRLRNVSKAFVEFESYMLEMCAARRAAETKDEKHDLFNSLLDARDEDESGGAKLTDRELLGNIFIFLLAGHEVCHACTADNPHHSHGRILQTTAHALAFTFALLAFHEDEQEKLYQHIKDVLKDGRTPVVAIPKHAAEDSTLMTRNHAGEKIVIPIPRDSSISINVCGLHYNPHYWDEPETFKPDRFLGNWPRDAFLPFSSGARSCLGRRFFETEGIAILAMLISRYRVELKDEPEFAHETVAERRARIMRCRQSLTTT
ncbi:hypothetical protein EIP86_004636 [Pleurotus ostreatoroseus]|nr:hypothetical protein EIP86_004636 [Pleurotus ostreatoroseus]